STHPLSVQRLADAQNRILRAERSTGASSDAFWYVRAKLRIEQARAGQALRAAEEVLRAETRQAEGVRRSAAWYGLAYSAWKKRDYAQAQEAVDQARGKGPGAPQLAGLGVAINLGRGESDAAVHLVASDARSWPDRPRVELAE